MKPLQNKVILVVDDEPDLREILAEELQDAGARVLTAPNGKLALEELKRSPVHAVISDIRMPGGDGLELLAAIRSRDPGIPIVILISGYSDLSPDQAYDMGAEGVFSKPCDFEDLIAALIEKFKTPSQAWVGPQNQLRGERHVRFKFEGLDKAVEAKVINIGRGGMFVRAPEKYTMVGKKVSFEVGMDEPGTAFTGVGVCRWTRAGVDGELSAGFGLEFLEMTEPSMNALLGLLARLKPRAFIPKD